MTPKAAEKWNSRYSGVIKEGLQVPRQLLIDYQHLLPNQGRALDIAMGLGSNANFLHEIGLNVTGIDISHQAARLAKRSFPNLPVFVADLENYSFPVSHFHVILNFYYFQKDLAERYAGMLVNEGLLFFETLHQDFLQIKPEINPAYLVAKDELLELFPGLEVIHAFEGWTENSAGKKKCIAQLIARKR